MSEEEIIRRRLIFDGDGTGEDRRLNDLIKNIAKWSKTAYEREDDCQLMFDKILAQLEFARHSRILSSLRNKQADVELERYAILFNELAANINQKNIEIDTQKANLQKSRIIKQNQIEYNLLAKSIKQETPRTESLKYLDSLESDISEVETRKELLDQLLTCRKNEFNALSIAAANLYSLLSKEGAARENMKKN